MYKSIHIQNFRCFEDTKIEGFEQINLIGGQNNAGKTVLLEALYIGGAPHKGTLEIILDSRRELDCVYEDGKNKPFRDFFHNQNEEKPIDITINDKSLVERKVNIQSKYYLEKNNGKFNTIAVLKVEGFNNQMLLYKSELSTILLNEKYEITIAQDFIDRIGFIPTNFQLLNLGEFYKRVVELGRKKYLLSAVKLLDKSIEELEFIDDKFHLKRMDETFISLNLFGDAIKKIFTWTNIIVSGQRKIILIDEIENGIHHTNQQKFWTMLFDLAAAFDIQIFATSHSAEMIKAFQEVATAHKIKGGYFELTRHKKTQKILGLKTQLDTLGLKVEHKMNYRG